jgi:putative transposase
VPTRRLKPRVPFRRNHAKETIALDFFTVPTATFKVLFVLIVLSHDRRRILHFNATGHPTAAWHGSCWKRAGPKRCPDT